MNPLDYLPLEVSQKIFSYQLRTMQPILCCVSKQWKALAEDDTLWNQAYGGIKNEVKFKPSIDKAFKFTPELIEKFGGMKRFVNYPKLDVTHKLTEDNRKRLKLALLPENFISPTEMTAPIMWSELPVYENLYMNVRGIIAMRITNTDTQRTFVESFYVTRFNLIKSTLGAPPLLEQTLKEYLNDTSPKTTILRLV